MSELRQRKVVKSTASETESESESESISMKQNKEKTPSTTPPPPPPPKWKVWILASRPHTLTASIVPVMVSSSLIHHYNYFQNNNVQELENYNDYTTTFISFLFGTFACLIQLGTNLYNDYSDFIKGADTDQRVGQARATQKGWLTPKETLYGSSGCLGLATCIGLYLTYFCSTSLSSSSSTSTSPPIDYYMIFVTISSVFNAYCYTGGEYPLGYLGMGHLSIGYSGLGDLFVFLYFGIVATITVPYIYLTTLSTDDNVVVWKSELMYICAFVSLPVGFLATNIIVVNNLRDRHTDVEVGKNTMAVRFGEWFSRVEYILMMIVSYLLLVPLSDILSMKDSQKNNLWVYLPLLSIPLAIKELKAVGLGGKDGSALNKHVGGAAKVQLVYCLLLIAGLHCSHHVELSY